MANDLDARLDKALSDLAKASTANAEACRDMIFQCLADTLALKMSPKIDFRDAVREADQALRHVYDLTRNGKIS